MILNRLRKVEQKLSERSQLIWHTYSQDYLERIQKYIPPEDFIRIKKEGGYWLPRSDPLSEINFSEELRKRENAKRY